MIAMWKQAAALGTGAVGGTALGWLGAREAQRQWAEQRRLIEEYRAGLENEITSFQRAGEQRISAQGEDIVTQSHRRGAATAASLARSGVGGTMGASITAAVRRSGAVERARFEGNAFPALGEVVATRRQSVRQSVLQALSSLGAEPSQGYGALQGLASVIPGLADLYGNLNKAE